MNEQLRTAVAALPPALIAAADRSWIASGEAPSPGLNDRLDSHYRSALEDAGWDVDVLIRHHVADLHAVKITVSDTHVLVFPDPEDDPVQKKLRPLPGVVWDGSLRAFKAPLHPRPVQAVRSALTGHRTVVEPAAADVLREFASKPIPTEVWAGDETLNVQTVPWSQMTDRLKQIPRTRWADTHWEIPSTPENAGQLVAIAETFGLVTDSSVSRLADELNQPLNYDGTIQGLMGVPTRELRTVAANPARGKTKSLEDRLAGVGIETVWDLLMHVPLRYIDRSTRTRLSELGALVGEDVTLIARVTDIRPYDAHRKLTRVQVGDGSGFLDVTFFRSPWINRMHKKGDEVLLHGRLSVYKPKSGGRPSLQMTNPMMDRLGESAAAMVPVYPQSEKGNVTTWDIHNAAQEAVRRLGNLADPFPQDVLTEHNLAGRKDSLIGIHAPALAEDATIARRRLAFDELLRMQLALGMERRSRMNETGIAHTTSTALLQQYRERLPYALTNAQEAALGAILGDLQQPHPMFRLLQGDVGCGKTTVALMSMLSTVGNGHQAALMAPTEILATQLFNEAAENFKGLTLPDGAALQVEFLGGKTTAKERRRILAGLFDGSVHVVVGTHALISDGVAFNDLGLIVVDEQHRFGVDQRAALRAKGQMAVPDMLVMTATPIPRSAALTVFGDLQQTVIDELPPGRTPIHTAWVEGAAPLDNSAARPWEAIRQAVNHGHQAYVVASLVEDNEKIAAASAEEVFTALTTGALSELRVGLVHGQMHRTERDATMASFKDGNLDVLVATTVIEVGVNVPNATLMVVLDAPRFGIAQLHQIRGRVGRGDSPSTCILVGEAKTDDGRTRMEALVESTDGFHLAEVDLRLRGSGALFGTRQSGQSDLRVASLPDDMPLVQECRAYAESLLTDDPELARRPVLRAEVMAALGDDGAAALSRS